MILKILEKNVHDQTIDYLVRYDILCKYQSGFRTKLLTDLCLSYLRDKMLKEFDNGLLIGMILTDLRKPFDIIDHNNILLEKSKAISFCDDIVN